MQKGTKHIYFSTKKRTRSYERRTIDPYAFERTDTCSLAVRGGLSNYRRIIRKHCRINDILKYINTDELFPMNSVDYTKLLIEVLDISRNFFDSLLTLRSTVRISNILRFANQPIKINFDIIETLIDGELQSLYPKNIRSLAKALKKNLIVCIDILNFKDENVNGEDWTSIQAMEYLVSYIRHMKTVCSFMHLIILKQHSTRATKLLPKQHSTRVTKMVPVIVPSSAKAYFCSVCGLNETICQCFVNCDALSNQNYDDFGYSPKGNINSNNKDTTSNQNHGDIGDQKSKGKHDFKKENVASGSTSYGPPKEVDDDFWTQYLKQHYVRDTDKRYSQEDSTDSD